MRHIIVGTAGHIDHGKTTLIKALTGRNTDRFEEEQKRGITIDLGFTYFDLPSGNRVGIIDVPGHEKFIANMVAGVVGMNMVLLVVAADEGIMPQTREHMDILSLLGVEKCIVVINKCDLVDEEWLDLVTEDLKEEFKGTFLEKAPMIPVSAATGAGIKELVETMDEMSASVGREETGGAIARLPIDRVFSLSGFGTVVTGTLISGKINKEDVLEMYPTGKECRIRSIQVHGVDEKTAYAGQRVAINISNLKKRELKRGYVLAPKNSMKDTDLLDVRLKVLSDSLRILKNHDRLHFFSGTSEVLCRAVLLDKEELGPGEEGFVQLRLEEKIALRKGDHFIVRFYSPMETIGGGVVLEPNPKIKKRFKEEVIKELEQKEQGTSADVILLRIKEYQDTFVSVSELAKLTGRSKEEISEDIKELKDENEVFSIDVGTERYVVSTTTKEMWNMTIDKALKDYEKSYPYRFGMKKAYLLSTFFKEMKKSIFDPFLEKLEEEKEISRNGEYVTTPDFEVLKDERFKKISNKLVDTLKKAQYDFVRYKEIEFDNEDREICDDVLNVLITEGKIVRVSEDFYTLSSYMEDAKQKITEKLKENPVITISEIRDMFSTSRKSAKPILEYMDSIRITKKTGGESERVAY